MQNHDHTATEASADADLILRTRSGDADAFGELWRRHYPSGVSVARSITSSLDPDDLVQEAYTRIYQAIIKGGGPNGSFRAYLFTSIRNTAAAWGRSRRETAMDELETIADPDSTEQAADEALDRSLTAQAFRGLPSRWQEVLWYTEIEQMKPAEVAPLLGMKAGAVSQLAFRAREGLREAWIQAHLKSAEPGSECQWTIEHLGAYSRGNLSARDQKRLDQHIEDCARCMIVVAEAKGVSDRLALVLLPLVLGVAGAAGYTATLQAGGAPVVAVAAMPSSVIEGGVVVSSGASGAVGAVAGDGGGTIGSGTGGTGAAGGSGTVTGIGALVGVGSAALVVASVVAATTIVPGLIEASPMTSLPSASEAGDSSISSELEPDTEMNDEKFILEIQEEDPKTPDDVDEAPEVKVPVVDDTPTTEVAPPVVAVTPTAPGPDSGADGDAGTTEPGTGPGTEEPGTEEPGTEEPGTEDPGTEEPGTEEPGTEEPGTEEPGTEDPGTEEPGTEEPGTEDPGTEDPDPEPELPSGTPKWNPASVTRDSRLITHYSVPMSGATEATVRALLDGSSGGADEVVLSVDGTGLIDLRPTLSQLCKDATVTFQYVAGDLVGETAMTTLYELSPYRPSPLLCLFDLSSAASAPTDSESPGQVENGVVATEPTVIEQPIASAEQPSAEGAAEPPVAESTPESVPAEGPAPSESAVAESTTVEDTALIESVPALPATAPTEDTTPAE